MHTTIAFTEEPAVTTEEFVAGVADDTHRISGNDIYIGKFNQIVAMFAGGQSLQTMRLVAPSLRRFMTPYIHPYVSMAADAYFFGAPVECCRNPIPLETNEALNAMATVSEVHADQDNFAGVSLSDGPVAVVHGDIRTMVIESTITSTQKTWVATDLTLAQDLPVGRYAIVGAECRANQHGIFRLIGVGQDNRPGGWITASNDVMSSMSQRFGNMGVWMEFDQLQPPRLEMCLNVTGSWYSLKLDLMQL